MEETLFEELKRYIGWSEADERALRALHPVAKPRFVAITEVFYETILAHEGARRSLASESQVGHLKITLQRWLDTLLAGPWDEAYYENRARIGRHHVRIALPQHYMFGAMNVIRRGLNEVIDETYLHAPADLALARRAVGRILDLELAVMLHTFREDLEAQAARTERLATFGQLVGSIGHDLRNPLGVIETSLFILRSRGGIVDERVKRHLDRIGDQLGVANGIITNLLDMIRNKPLSKERVQLEAVMSSAAEAVARPEAVRYRAEGLAGMEVDGDPIQLRQVFVNLLSNAVEAAGAEGEVLVLARRAADGVTVAVEDSGPGVDPGTARRLFEPLITTKDRGIGLGLALVKRIVERHGGSVGYEPRQGGGARFTVHLPA